MAIDFPQAGQVFDYHYLWKWQDSQGETEGRKKRPCCMALVTVNTGGQHVLFIAPITTKKPAADCRALVIPETEAHRADLDTNVPLWIVVDELNADVLETSYTLEDRVARGRFGSAFTDAVLREVQAIRRNDKLGLSLRT